MSLGRAASSPLWVFLFFGGATHITHRPPPHTTAFRVSECGLEVLWLNANVRESFKDPRGHIPVTALIQRHVQDSPWTHQRLESGGTQARFIES